MPGLPVYSPCLLEPQVNAEAKGIPMHKGLDDTLDKLHTALGDNAKGMEVQVATVVHDLLEKNDPKLQDISERDGEERWWRKLGA